MSDFVKSSMDQFMFGMVIETSPKFYMVQCTIPDPVHDLKIKV